jgi:hypothetical protein
MCQRRSRQPISPAPGRPQGGSPPSLRTRTRLCHRPVSFTAFVASTAKHHKCKSIATSGTTVASAAAIRCVAVPELSIAVFAPALDAPVVLRSAASFNIHPEDGAGCLQGVSKRPASFFRRAISGARVISRDSYGYCSHVLRCPASLASASGAYPKCSTRLLPIRDPTARANGVSRLMLVDTQSTGRWTSERRPTRAEARRPPRWQTPPICRRSFAHTVQKKCLS